VNRFLSYYLKAIMLKDNIKDKTAIYLPQVLSIFKWLGIIWFIVEVFVLLLPCIVSTLVFFPTYPSFNLIRLTICSLVFFYFAIKIRLILANLSESIQKIVSELDTALRPWIGVIVIGWTLLLFFITVPTLAMNQYIVSPLVLLCFQSVNSAILFFIKLPQYQDAEKKSQEMRKIHPATQKSYRSPQVLKLC